jgi:opacity protein-like surface antigen
MSHLLKFGALVGASCLLVSGQSASAQTTAPVSYEQGTGFYGTIGLGASWTQSVDANISEPPRSFNNAFGSGVITANPSGTLNFGGGFAGEAGIGYDFGAVRTELTYVYNNANVDGGNINVNPRLAFNNNINIYNGTARVNLNDGSVNTNSVMASAYVDIPTGSRFVPYVGGGIGYTNVNWSANFDNNVRLLVPALSPVPITDPLNNTLNGRNYSRSGNASLFGYQAKIGVSYVASCTTDVFAEGTYQGATGFEIQNVDYSNLNAWGARAGVRFRFADTCKKPVAAVRPMPEPAPIYQAPQEPVRGLW